MLHVVITTHHRHAALAPLLANRGIAELPVVGRTLLERALEAVAPLSPDRVSVVADTDAERLAELVGDGRRWGVRAEVVGAGQLAAEGEASTGRLTLRCDRLYDVDLRGTLDELISGSDEGRRIVREPLGVEWHPGGGHASPRTLELSAAGVMPIESPAAYHAAALATSRGEHVRLPVGGRERAHGLRHGHTTLVHPGSVQSGRAWIGRSSHVHATARLSGTVVVGDRTCIGRMTTVHDAVVLDDTLVGEHLDVRHAVVAGGTIVRVDTGTVLRVTDKFLLCARGTSLRDEYLGGPARRLLARRGSAPVHSSEL